ncbi:Microsomal dipeptidase [hydrothermal vent metagenome]|uniref:Microsomal dipeptidase n=1 Tax=hydrothermal vent metagenome TaxID=652676 RepID=A0A1W1BP71_9ZZZZ
MNFIDLHCDTASLMLENNQPLLQNNLQVDIKKLQKGDALAQFFAIYIDKNRHKSSYDYSLKMIKNLKKELLLNKESIILCRNSKDLKLAEKSKKIGAFLTIEEGDALEGDLDRLYFFKDIGISAITLTWNYENDLGYPNFEWKYQNRGLKRKGFEAVEIMNSIGMMIDVSHLSDKGFSDVLNHSKSPFLATHSNSRFITNHSRNLSDLMLKQLANSGGVAGLAFSVNFLQDKDIIDSSKLAKIEDMVRHIKHIRNIAGIEVLALGSDFDGITNPVEINNSSEMAKLSDALLKNGFSYNDIERIFFKNALRIIKDVLG